MMDTKGKFYLGKQTASPGQGSQDGVPVLYKPDDLMTHAVVVGMTGSGKTGLCVSMLEEAALNNLPAIMIDPKGDITNLLLHFPDLLPQDFQPWVNADEARREGISVEQAAETIAARWRKGLEEWEITPDRMRALQNAVHFSIYTPGSEAGLPISILASLKVPEIPWAENAEILRERISGTVTALLGLVGMEEVDPVRSREHILLSNIFENAWSKGKDLQLDDLILQVQTPPFQKLGIFDINQFFPEKDRFGLAMLLNNILASPGFQSWIQGEPLDIPSLLFAPDGCPRHTVFYIAHLSDTERMFFVTLLYSSIETWMRTQSGTTSLRALVYFDEIFGYLPPSRNPPSKTPILRMLKQARAFGVGLVLVTQNPVDLDYKALANAGSWFIGKLQTERDKQRLLDGLEGAAAGSMDRGEYNDLLSNLGKRVFLLHNVHASRPILFQTRWAMNYLAGPLSRPQIVELNRLKGVEKVSQISTRPAASTPAAPAVGGYAAPSPAPVTGHVQPVVQEHGLKTRPAIPAGVDEYFLPNNLTLSQAARQARRSLPADASQAAILYRPVLLAQAQIRYANRKYNLDTLQPMTVLIEEPDPRGLIQWEEYEAPLVDRRTLDRGPVPQARFTTLTAPFTEPKAMNSLRTAFVDWLFRTATVTVRAHTQLGVFAGPEVSQADFRRQCSEAARTQRAAEIDKITQAYARKLTPLSNRLDREIRKLEENKVELQERKMEEYGTHAENLLGLFSGRKRRLSTSLSKRRMTQQTKVEMDQLEITIKNLESEIADLQKESKLEIEAAEARWVDIVDNVEEIEIRPLKKDILPEFFGLAWFPYLLVAANEGQMELPGYAVFEQAEG